MRIVIQPVDLEELTRSKAKIQGCRGVAQSGSASGLGPEGRRFESYRPDQLSHHGLTEDSCF